LRVNLGRKTAYLTAASLATIAILIAGAVSYNTAAPKASAAPISLAALSVLGSETSMGSAPSSGEPARPANAKAHGYPSCAFGQWLTTSGPWIVNSGDSCKVRLAGVTWYGMQSQYYVPAGLDYLSYKAIIDQIAALGFNSIRMPISDYLVKYNDNIHVSQYLKANQDLIGLKPLLVLDKLIDYAGQKHLWVILDNHVSNPVTKSQIHTEQKTSDPYWYAKGFPEQTWISDWTALAQRYKDNPTVTGFDLRNEPHTKGPGPWKLKVYLKNGATWGPCTVSLCGSDTKLWNKGSDWAAAATRCANAILDVNPHLLMFVEGVQLYPEINKTHPQLVDSYWWGSILKGVATDPINLANSGYERQLVYSPHEWGPWKYRSPQFYRGPITYKSFAKLFNSQWAFILHMKSPHPIWLGEFNTCNTHVNCVTGKHAGSQGWWFQFMASYLANNPEIGWSYYPINGTNSLDEASNNSILYRTWKTVDKRIMSTLQTILQPPS
jgi:endoglucanase